jgi:spore maturation protein CgeB
MRPPVRSGSPDLMSGELGARGSELSKILYGAVTTIGATSEHRLRAFRRTGHQVQCFSFSDRVYGAPPSRWLADRFQFSPGVAQLNHDLIEVASREKPDLIWLDKPIWVYPRTVERLRGLCGMVVAYTPDDPFGPRGDRVWRHFKPSLDLYSAHVVPRDVTRTDFEARGVKKVVVKPFGFEPSIHLPPGSLGLAPPKEFDFTFIGYPHDERATWIADALARFSGLKFGLFGEGWGPYMPKLAKHGVTWRGAVWNDHYVDVIWRSRLSLSFVTRSNRDVMSHKAIEISAAGTAAMVEPSPIHSEVFVDGESAIFFSQADQLGEAIERALADPEALLAVGVKAAAAVRAAGLSNDDIIRSALAELGYQPEATAGRS